MKSRVMDEWHHKHIFKSNIIITTILLLSNNNNGIVGCGTLMENILHLDMRH